MLRGDACILVLADAACHDVEAAMPMTGIRLTARACFKRNTRCQQPCHNTDNCAACRRFRH